MDSTRRGRLAEVIREELSIVVPREIKDPRVPSITFTRVEVTQDGGQATVWFTILGGSQGGLDGTTALSDQEAALRMQDCIQGLVSASGFLRRYLAKALTTRHIPTLIFKEDRGFENTLRVHQLLTEINSQPGNSQPSPEADSESEKK
jgi:ribosome-binding factor A